MSKNNQTYFMPMSDETTDGRTRQAAPLRAAPMAQAAAGQGSKESGMGKAVASAAVGFGATIVAVAAFTGWTEDNDGHSHDAYDDSDAARDYASHTEHAALDTSHHHIDHSGGRAPHDAAADTGGVGSLDGVLVDIDGDGTPDGVLVDTNGDGTLDTLMVDLDGNGTLDVALVDLDGDGTPDVVIDISGTPEPDIVPPYIEDAHEFADDYVNDAAVDM